MSMTCVRGFGGVAILWRKEIDHHVKYMEDGNARLQLLHIENSMKPLCLANIYMPSDSKNADLEYKRNLDQIQELLTKFRPTHDILICRDMNGSLHRSKTSR